ncbi:MAG: HlyC/CorC family transporter [Chloroflexi bacterium]|nr:HlyC/CorC family transporter [Chloroflexota bacterium]
MDTEPFSPWGLLALIALLGVNAFFVAAEYALVSVRRTRIDELINQGIKEAKFVRGALNNLDRYIATTQLCITMAGIGLGWVGEPTLTALLVLGLGLPLQWLDPYLRRVISVTISFAVVTFATVVLSELVPKSIALKYTEQVALAVGRITVVTGALFRPFIWALDSTASLVLRLIGVPPAGEHGPGYSVQELKLMVEASEKIGVIENIEREMLHAVFDFGDLTAHEVMVPRTEMRAIDADAPVHELIHLAIQHPLSKFPVYEGDIDHIIGIAHTKDLVRIQHGERREATIRGFMREALFVPDTIKLDALLHEFRSKRQHMAIVLDEYGGTAGLVTLDDLISQIMGPVSDAFDKSTPEIQRLPDGSALIEGMTLIEVVNDYFGLRLADENYDTIAGFMLGKLERMAKVGDTVETDGAKLKVEAMDGLRIARVSLFSSQKTEVSSQKSDVSSQTRNDSDH